MSYPVSVVVPTCRRVQELQRCLEALQAQSLAQERYEIIVVDDAGDLATQRLVERLGARSGPRLRYRRCTFGAHGPAAARNAGWRVSLGDIVAFTDDDTVPDRDWLTEGLRAFEDDVAAVWGQVVVPLPATPTDSQRNTGGLADAEFVTANCFVRRAALTRVGGFDERFTRPWREDSDLYFSLLEHGFRVVSAPAAIVVHPPRLLPIAACLHQHRNLLFDALLYKKHRHLYREKIAAKPPLRYYLIVAVLLCALLALAFGALPLAGGAFALWLALTAWLSLQRLRGIARSWRDVVGIALTSAAIPPLAVFWRLAGSLRFRVWFA